MLQLVQGEWKQSRVASKRRESLFALPHQLVIPRKHPLKNWVPPDNVIVVYGTNGNFNENVISEHYIPKVLVDYKNEKRF